MDQNTKLLVDLATDVGEVKGLVKGLHEKVDSVKSQHDSHLSADAAKHGELDARVLKLEQSNFRLNTVKAVGMSVAGIAWTVLVWLYK